MRRLKKVALLIILTALLALPATYIAYGSGPIPQNGDFESWGTRTVTYNTSTPSTPSGTATSTAELPDNWEVLLLHSSVSNLDINGVKKITTANTGVFALRLGGTGGGDPGFSTGYHLGQDHPACQGDVYKLKYFGRNPDGIAATRVSALFLGSSKNFLGVGLGLGLPFAPNYILLQGNTPPASLGAAFVRVSPQKNAFGFSDFDDVSLTLVTPGTCPVGIDIKPGSFPNSINPKSRGTIPVAILSTAAFDAPSRVDRSSLTFGKTGNEASLAFCNSSPEDVNGDGLLDLICHFRTQQTGFQPGDTEGILKGEDNEGRAIIGRDSVRIVN